MRNNRGFTLIQVMIAAGMLGALSIAAMKIMTNIQQSQTFVTSSADEIELKSFVNLIFTNEKYCRVSIAGEGPPGNPNTPLTFEKKIRTNQQKVLNLKFI